MILPPLVLLVLAQNAATDWQFIVPIAVAAIALLSAALVAWMNRAGAKAGVTPETMEIQRKQIHDLFEEMRNMKAHIDELERRIDELQREREEERELRHQLRNHISILEELVRRAGVWVTEVAVPTLDRAGVDYEPPPRVVRDWWKMTDRRREDEGPPSGREERRQSERRLAWEEGD